MPHRNIIVRNIILWKLLLVLNILFIGAAGALLLHMSSLSKSNTGLAERRLVTTGKARVALVILRLEIKVLVYISADERHVNVVCVGGRVP